MHAIHKRHPSMNVRFPEGHGMISLPEVGIEAAEENPSTHGIGAIKHLTGEDELSKKYDT